MCSIGPHWIVKQLMAMIQDHVNGLPAEKYWKTKFQLLDMLWNSINWQDLGQAYHESLGMAIQQWAVKYTLGFFGHGQNMA